MNIRFLSLTAAALLMCGLAGGQVFGQQLKLQVDRQTGALNLTGVDELAVDFAGYSISSNRATIDDSAWNGIRDTEADWVVAGTASSSYVAELNSNGNPAAGSVVNDTVTLDLGTGAYSPAAVLASLPLGEDIEQNDLSLSYYNQLTNVTAAGVVEFVGEKIFNDIGITVDLSDGRAYIENESPNNLTITGYLVESNAGGTLNTNGGTFGGLGSGFQSPTTLDGDNLGEIDPTGTGQLLASSMAADTLGIDLGVVVDPGSAAAALDDLTFSFILQGAGEVSQTGFVKYINPVPTVLFGDADNDLAVAGSDLLAVTNNFGNTGPADGLLLGDADDDGAVAGSDLLAVTNNFGNTAGAGGLTSGAAVPEPSALLLALAGCVAVAAKRALRN